MQESRLFRIVYHILEKGSATAPELAERFEVSVRTIYRDIDAISSAGIPIYAVAGRHGGIRISDDYVLERTAFSDAEKKDILAALESVSLVSSTLEKERLTKLAALFRVQTESWFEVDFGRWGSNEQDNARFELLKTATTSRRVAEIVYYSSNGHKTHRKICPLKLCFISREWYVKAFCCEKQSFRLFKLNRILSCQVLHETFPPMKYQDVNGTQAPEYSVIVLRFSKEAAYRVYDEFRNDEIIEQENGDMVVTAHMPEDLWLVGYILSFGSSVEVVEPVHLRHVLVSEAKKILEKHKT